MKPYNHNYTMHLSIGFSGAEHSETINPSKDSSYSEEEWNELSEDEQQEWLDEEAGVWAQSYVEISVTA